MGWCSDRLHERATDPMAYLPLYVTLAVMMVIASFASPLIAHLGPPQGPAIEPLSEISPATAEPAM
jgi:hypothetical protein